MLAASIAGFVTGMSLIVAIGAQNAYVLRQGVLRSHAGAVVAVCTFSDVMLILAGVGGLGVLIDRAGYLLDAARWFGVCFLLWYAAGALRRARRVESMPDIASSDVGESRRGVIGRAVALTWLNPHVYLDTVLLLGSIAATHDAVPAGRWWFAVGAALASAVWFNALGFGARLLAPVLARPRSWQVLEFCLAATMVLVAARLAVG